ncbi:hypothetical protein Tco_0276154 [Tanacetum coccineum]
MLPSSASAPPPSPPPPPSPSLSSSPSLHYSNPNCFDWFSCGLILVWFCSPYSSSANPDYNPSSPQYRSSHSFYRHDNPSTVTDAMNVGCHIVQTHFEVFVDIVNVSASNGYILGQQSKGHKEYAGPTQSTTIISIPEEELNRANDTLFKQLISIKITFWVDVNYQMVGVKEKRLLNASHLSIVYVQYSGKRLPYGNSIILAGSKVSLRLSAAGWNSNWKRD